jgi:hypothetical protein
MLSAIRSTRGRGTKRPRGGQGARVRAASPFRGAAESVGVGRVDAGRRFSVSGGTDPALRLPIPQARLVSAAVTMALLVALGVGRARIAKRGTISTIMETVTIGVAAAMAGVTISVLIDRGFSV